MEFITIEKDEFDHPWFQMQPTHLRLKYLGIYVKLKSLVFCKYRGVMERDALLVDLRKMDCFNMAVSVLDSPLGKLLSRLRTRACTPPRQQAGAHVGDVTAASNIIEKKSKRKKKYRDIVCDNTEKTGSFLPLTTTVSSLFITYEHEPWFPHVFALVDYPKEELLEGLEDKELLNLMVEHWNHTLSYFMLHVKSRQKGDVLKSDRVAWDYFLNYISNKTTGQHLLAHLKYIHANIMDYRQKLEQVAERMGVSPDADPDTLDREHMLYRHFIKLNKLIHGL